MIYIKNLKKDEKLKLEAVEVLPGGERGYAPSHYARKFLYNAYG